MDVNRSEPRRRNGLAFCLDLIDGYERDRMRTREWNPVRTWTPEEIRRECDSYRRRACVVWGFPFPPQEPIRAF